MYPTCSMSASPKMTVRPPRQPAASSQASDGPLIDDVKLDCGGSSTERYAGCRLVLSHLHYLPIHFFALA